VITATVFSAVVTNVLADENDGEEKIVVSLNPDVATDEYIHMVWQENLTGNMEIYFVSNMTKNFEDTLLSTISIVETLIAEDEDYEDVLKELNNALEEYNEGDFKHSINKIHHAVKDLEKVDNTELIMMLIDAVRDFAKTNILYAEYDLTFNNTYIQEAYEKYHKAVDKYEADNYDAAIKMFKNSYLKIVEAYEENDETFIGIDFRKIVRISYTNFDSVTPQIFLNGTIHVGWKEIMDSEPHVYYARSTNNGITWWYFDASEHASPYLSYLGIDPYTTSIENALLITRTLEKIWIIGGCHFFYVPLLIDSNIVYGLIDDPYFDIYEYDDAIIIDGSWVRLPIRGPCLPLPSPKAPDLTVTNISFSNNNPLEGETITVYATVKNIGDAFVSGVIADVLRYDPSLTNLGNVTDIYLSPSESVQVSMGLAPNRGYYELRVIADPNNDLPEGLENNNDLVDRIIIAGIKKDDWIVSTSESYTDKIILCNSLSVISGHLSLTDTILIINCSANGTADISIANGAALTLTNTSVTSTKPGYFHYNFDVHGTLQVIRSTISHTSGGICLYSDSSSSSSIVECAIINGATYGLYCEGVELTIRDSHIADNGCGIYVDASTIEITNTSIVRNDYGVYGVNGTTLTIVSSFIKGTTSDIYVDGTSTYSTTSGFSAGEYRCGEAVCEYKDGNRIVRVEDAKSGDSTEDDVSTWGMWYADSTHQVTAKVYYMYDEGGWLVGDNDKNEWHFWMSVFKTNDKYNQNWGFIEQSTKTFTDNWGQYDYGHGWLEVTITADWRYQKVVTYMGARYWWKSWYDGSWDSIEDQDDYFAYIQKNAVIDPIEKMDATPNSQDTGSMSFSITKGAGTTSYYPLDDHPYGELNMYYGNALELTASWYLPALTSAYQYLAGEETIFTLTVWVADVTSPSSYVYWGSTSYTAPLGIVDQSGTLAVSGSVDGIQTFKCKLEVEYNGRNPLKVDTYDYTYSYVMAYPEETQI
jgi:tetratricopeptide (TPR) repeat protein